MKLTVVAPAVSETAAAGIAAGAGSMAKAAVQVVPSRLTIASWLASAMAVSTAGPLALIRPAKAAAMASCAE